MQRISHLQSLRAVAAILVVWAHAIDLASGRKLSAWQVDFGYLQNFGAVGVDIFFVISGFIVSISASKVGSPADFLIRRAIRIWPLYTFATLVMFAITPSEWLRPDRLLWSLTFIQEPGDRVAMPTHPLGWSLMFEASFYLLLVVAMLWRSARPLGERALILLTVTVCLGSMERFAQPLNIVGNPIVVEFALGVLIGLFWSKRPQLPKWAVMSLFIAGSVFLLRTAMYGFGVISEAPSTLDASASWERVRLWGVPSALLVASAVFRPQGQGSRSMSEFLGDASYSIYLFSLPVLCGIDWKWTYFAALPADVAIVCATAIAICGGVVAYVLVERPLLRYLAQRYSGRRCVIPGL